MRLTQFTRGFSDLDDRRDTMTPSLVGAPLRNEPTVPKSKRPASLSNPPRAQEELSLQESATLTSAGLTDILLTKISAARSCERCAYKTCVPHCVLAHFECIEAEIVLNPPQIASSEASCPHKKVCYRLKRMPGSEKADNRMDSALEQSKARRESTQLVE